ncbi:MAG: right-handed parallel beta-helix repeat-containing protein [Planctomycetes bacterium]|nr:right-handed parallel beta-helix repeat-containing protein [Planctomycetota bacterium]
MRSFGMTLTAVLLLLSCSAWATVYNVPGDAETIQDAINLCFDGDSVVVDPGTYTGAGNRDISLWGKKITVASTDPDDAATVGGTVIDCQDSGSGFVLNFGETAESVVAGFTIINGNGGLMGGGLYIASGSSPVVRNCVIVDCSASLGGAIAVDSSLPTIKNCRILGNTAGVGGGALYINGGGLGGPLFDNCIISGNSAPRGGAVYSQNPGVPVFAHCTITTNTAETYGGAINCFNESNLILYGCILWDNAASAGTSQMLVGGVGLPTTVDVSYCNVQGIDTDIMVFPGSGVAWGLGNIEADPMFIEAGYMAAGSTSEQAGYVEGDFGLAEESPCVDAGDPDYVAEEGATDVYGAQRIFGEVIDIGAAEFAIEELETIEAKIRFRPKVISLRGRQKWLFCTIKLKDYKAEDIDTETVEFLMGGESITPIREKRRHRGKDLKVRFKMDEIRQLVGDSGKTITLTVQGVLKEGAVFAGVDTLKIYRPRGKHHKAKPHGQKCR